MSELRTDSREWVHRIIGSLDRMLVGIENLAVGEPSRTGRRTLPDRQGSVGTVETEQTHASRIIVMKGEYPTTSWVVKSFTGRVILRKCFQENYREAYMSSK